MPIGYKKRWTNEQRAWLNQDVVLYQKDNNGHHTPDSLSGGTIIELQTTFLGHLFVMIKQEEWVGEGVYVGMYDPLSRRHELATGYYFALLTEDLP